MVVMGDARYCDKCGVEIWSGDKCSGCDPKNGGEEVTIRFMIWKENDEE